MAGQEESHCASQATIEKGASDGTFLVVDVRRSDEITSSGKIAAKRWLNLVWPDEYKSALDLKKDQFKAKYGDIPADDGSNLIINCGSGKRSAMALQVAFDHGYTKARHFTGGYGNWKK